VVAGSPEQVYTYLADHVHHHPKFLPPAFYDYQVEEGGLGAGTVISYRLKVGGRERQCRARIEEPEPGRVISEHLTDGTVTTFTLTRQGNGTLVRIDTRWRRANPVQNWIESKLGPHMLAPLFKDELFRLDAYARSQPALV
jgi:hypothetical protein